MILGVSGLIAAYVLIALLLLSINLYSNWSWRVKAATVIITTAFYIVTYLSFPPLLGWPTRQLPPERFRLLAAQVEQPNKATGTEGRIYLWLSRMDNPSTSGPPRAYELPYTEALHEVVITATSKLSKGLPQMGELDAAILKQVEDITLSGQKSVPIQFYDLPDPLFPEK